MKFINSYSFKAEIGKASLMGFIAAVPPEFYCFIISATDGYVYGYFLTQELVEYFTNEFPVKTFEIVKFEDVRTEIGKSGVAVWGNSELLLF